MGKKFKDCKLLVTDTDSFCYSIPSVGLLALVFDDNWLLYCSTWNNWSFTLISSMFSSPILLTPGLQGFSCWKPSVWWWWSLWCFPASLLEVYVPFASFSSWNNYFNEAQILCHFQIFQVFEFLQDILSNLFILNTIMRDPVSSLSR